MKKRNTPKYLRKVSATSNPAVRAAFYAETDHADETLAENQVAAGIILHPKNRLWQLWLSTNGLDVTCLAAYRDQVRAEKAHGQLKAFLGSQAAYESEKCADLFGRLRAEGDGEPALLPDDLVRVIGRQIVRERVDGKRGER